MATGARKHVLDGVKVLDFTQFLAGPTVTRLMAEMGAEVIKLELAPTGDRTRYIQFLKNGRSGYFVQQNRGKMSLCLDLKTPAAQTIVRELIAKVDVLVENFAPGVMARMGFAYELANQLNPNLIMCSVSTYGQTGPLAQGAGYDFMGQAYAGVTWLSGMDGEAPAPPMLGIGDVSTGVHAMAAIGCALFHPARGGGGQHLDISLLDAYFHYQDVGVQLLSASGGKQQLSRDGSHYPNISPASLFQIGDRYLWIFAFLDHHWAELCRLMERPELIHDSRFADNASRVTNRAEVNRAITDWLHTLPNLEAAVRVLKHARIPSAPVLSVEEAMNHPHLRQRRAVRKIRDRLMGEFEVPGFPLRFSAFPAELELEVPLLGEHNDQILAGWLNYGPERIQALKDQGVLHSLER